VTDPEREEAWAAMSFLHEALSELCPPGSLPSEEAINARYGPTFLGYAKAFVAAVRQLHDVAIGERRS
jgi:hypothetical protein